MYSWKLLTPLFVSLVLIPSLCSAQPANKQVTPIPGKFTSHIIVDNRSEQYILPVHKDIDPEKVKLFIPLIRSNNEADQKIASDEILKLVKTRELLIDVRYNTKLNQSNCTGRSHAVTADQFLNPTLMVFVKSKPDPADGIAQLSLKLRELMMINKYKNMNFGSFVFFLNMEKEYEKDDKREDAKKEVEDWAVKVGEANVKNKHPNEKIAREQAKVGLGGVVIGINGKESDDVKNWKLEDDVTVVLYDYKREVQRWSFKDGEFKEPQPILDAARKLMDDKK